MYSAESFTPLSVHGFIHNASCPLPFTHLQSAPNLNCLILIYPGIIFEYVCLSVNLFVSLLFLLSQHSVPSRICVSGSALSLSLCKECGLKAPHSYHPFSSFHFILPRRLRTGKGSFLTSVHGRGSPFHHVKPNKLIHKL